MEPEHERSGSRRVLAGIAVLAVVGVVGGWGVAQRSRPKPVAVHVEAETSRPGGTPGGLYVHVAGAVGAPGLYRLDPGARVDDALRAAGGPREDADLDSVNLAAKVADGDKLLIPVRGAAGSGGAGPPGTSGGKVNLNTATAAELETLPGVGPSTARKIIDFRTSNGPFRTVKDLQKVPGIGPKRLEQLADLIVV